jgi:hypothetical protein
VSKVGAPASVRHGRLHKCMVSLQYVVVQTSVLDKSQRWIKNGPEHVLGLWTSSMVKAQTH